MAACIEHVITPADCAALDMRFEKPFRFRGRLFPSAENAYQSSKFSDRKTIDQFQYIRPDTAAYCGAVRPPTIPDWDHTKITILSEVLDAKFSDPVLRENLKQTGTAPIILINFRHENDLGTCACRKCRMRGKNIAGQILEQLREKL